MEQNLKIIPLSLEEALSLASSARHKIKQGINEKAKARVLYWQPLYDQHRNRRQIRKGSRE